MTIVGTTSAAEDLKPQAQKALSPPPPETQTPRMDTKNATVAERQLPEA